MRRSGWILAVASGSVVVAVLFIGCGNSLTSDRPTAQTSSASHLIQDPRSHHPTPRLPYYVSMVYAGSAPTTDPTYGEIDGYSLISPTYTPDGRPPKLTPGPSQILRVRCNSDIIFVNFDTTSLHTASTLTPEGNGFPAHFDNPNGPNPSPPMTPISEMGYVFSSGLVEERGVSPGFSAVYSTGNVPGAYFMGDYLFYDSTPSMRTVIIVKGC